MSAPDSPGPTVFVLFGATGDLAKRLVLPSFFRLVQEKLLPDEWRLIGSGRREKSDDEFRDDVQAALEEFGGLTPEDGPWDEFSAGLRFAGGGFTADDPGALLDRIAEARGEIGQDAQLVHYLGLPPTAFGDYTRALGAHGLAEGARVVYEKPFGTSLESFRELDRVVHEVLDESQVFRIDHFLGKEATQELRALRFANGLFGSSWDRHHVAAVQIDVPETLDVADRAEFYDATGAVLDMLVTHLFQVAAEVAMEPPASFRRRRRRRRPRRGRAPASARCSATRWSADSSRATATSSDVADDSTTETFVAARLWIDSDRWRGVPFLLRTGKRMAESRQKVNLVFRKPEDGPVDPDDLPTQRQRPVLRPRRRRRPRAVDERQDARRLDRAGHDVDPDPARRPLRRRPPPAVRAPDPRRAGRRPGPVHPPRRPRGRLDRGRGGARRPPAARELRPGLLGPRVGGAPRRPRRLGAAGLTHGAGRTCSRRSGSIAK